jgi:hypothetical protein
MKIPKNENLAWFKFYAYMYNIRAKNADEVGMRDCAHLAAYYQLLCLRDGEWEGK